MKERRTMFFMVLAIILMCSVTVMADESVSFEPVMAPSMGPDNAPVTIIEIADYM